ncbi:hypothetical protein GCK72_013862 [Caenorhabditis remanei]|uniref:Major sperm protein n=1 Tax=Caenorhabditis remanei TaxID=31234 RepID=A0A6A5GS64_CAERE|nr:hypothetical protein GCK72_013862 [Caenorhabditis remanei]KAF1757406.1 hypothetical protein GCK72_013862 [Caenorhabditis remanei]
MISIFSILVFIAQITVFSIGCAGGSNNNGNEKRSRFGFRSGAKTKFHVKGDTEVATLGPVSMASTVSKVTENADEKKISHQDTIRTAKDKTTVKSEDKTSEKENPKSQKTERKGEKKPLISVEPSGDSLAFKLESESQIRLTFKNISDEKIMFKMKVSDHSYNMNPVFGTLEIGESSDVIVTHTPSQCKEAKLVIVNSKYAGDVDLAKSFRNRKPTGGPITINLVAT